MYENCSADRKCSDTVDSLSKKSETKSDLPRTRFPLNGHCAQIVHQLHQLPPHSPDTWEQRGTKRPRLQARHKKGNRTFLSTSLARSSAGVVHGKNLSLRIFSQHCLDHTAKRYTPVHTHQVLQKKVHLLRKRQTSMTTHTNQPTKREERIDHTHASSRTKDKKMQIRENTRTHINQPKERLRQGEIRRHTHINPPQKKTDSKTQEHQAQQKNKRDKHKRQHTHIHQAKQENKRDTQK